MSNRIDVGLFFFFVACAGVSIIVWIFNWICWLNQCCCCDFLHNPVNKRIAWWISFTFLLGMLACCISACVTVNRFGFALDGALCSLDRIYYDFKNGQLVDIESEYPKYSKWIGFSNLQKVLKNLGAFENPKINELKEEAGIYEDEYNDLKKSFDDLIKSFDVKSIKYLKDYFSVDKVDETENNINNFELLKNKFLKECHDYGNILFGWMKVLSMIYYCLFLITITLAGVSMMFYACLKRQGYLITIMHILWNIIRFFMFSFFIFGAAYGIFYLVLKDSVAVVKKLFSENLCNSEEENLIPCAFLGECIQRNYNFANEIDYDIQLKIQNFYYRYKELYDILINEGTRELKTYLESICDSESGLNCGELPNYSHFKGGIFGFFNCRFLETDLNMVYRTLYDASKESEILSALSLTSSFFGAIAVYFYLLVLHHYNNELFFDSGKSIFRGFDGFGAGYKNKIKNKDPAYKKRKLRAEIELTSRNEDDNHYQNINKNEED